MNLVNLTLLLLVGGASYAGWLFIPLWLDDLDVREAVSAAWGQLAYDSGDERIRDALLLKLHNLGSHYEEQDGKQVEVPGLALTAQDIQIERDPANSTGRVAVEYTRTVKLKPFERYYPIHFLAERSGLVRQ